MGAAFRRLWLAAAAANLGDGLMITALPLIALGAGASVGEVALVATAATIAWPLVGLHAGWLVDRVPIPALLVGVGGARVLVFAGLAVSAATGTGVVPAVFAAAVVYGLAETLADTALIAAVPAVTAPDRLTAANARIEAAVNATNQLAGPPLAGLLIGVSGALAAASGSALYAIAGLAALDLARLMGRPWRRAPASGTDPHETTGRVLGGIRFLFTHPLQCILTILTAAMNLVWGAWSAVFVLHAVAPGPLGLSPAGYGWVLAAMAAGGIAASAATDALARRIDPRTLLFVDALGTIALVAPAAARAPAWAVIAGLVLAGAGASVWRILVAVVRQQTTPAGMLGRVYAASRVVSWGTLPLGSALAGLGAATIGVGWTLAAASAVAALLALAFLACWRRLALPTEPAAREVSIAR